MVDPVLGTFVLNVYFETQKRELFGGVRVLI